MDDVPAPNELMTPFAVTLYLLPVAEPLMVVFHKLTRPVTAIMPSLVHAGVPLNVIVRSAASNTPFCWTRSQSDPPEAMVKLLP